jgi:hypothetical protein
VTYLVKLIDVNVCMIRISSNKQTVPNHKMWTLKIFTRNEVSGYQINADGVTGT